MSKTAKLGGIMLVSIVSLQVVRIIAGFINLSDNLSEWLFNFVMQVCCLGVLPLVLYKLLISNKKGAFAYDIRLNTRISPISFLLAIAIGFLGYIINMGASAISYMGLELLGYTFIKGGGTIYSGPEVLIFEIIGTAIFPAIFEEITNRGVLMAAFDGEKDDKIKIILMGLFFGAFHQNVAQFFPTFIIGIVISYMAVKSQSILPGMIVHFMNNFFITITSYNTQTGGVVGSVMNKFDNFIYSNVIVLTAAVLLAAWLICLCLKYFAKINESYREKRDPLPEKAGEDGYIDKATVRENIYGIYGYPVQDRSGDNAINYTVNHERRIGNKKARTVNLKDYVFLIIAYVSAFVVTIFTYVWGLFR